MNNIIVDVLCKYLYRLKYFFKEEFYIAEKNVYVIPTRRLLAMKRQLLPLIVEGHGEMCEKNDPYNYCDPHKFKKCLEDIYNFLEILCMKKRFFIMHSNSFLMKTIRLSLVGLTYRSTRNV